MKFTELYDVEWKHNPLKKRFLKQDKKVQDENGDYLLNVSSRAGKDQLIEKKEQFLNPKRIRKELERFRPPRSSLNNYDYLVLKFGILKYLCRTPDYSEEEDELIGYIRNEWEQEILDEYKGKTERYTEDEFFHLTKAASEYEGKMFHGELNLIYRYMKEHNSDEQYETGKIWWGDFFVRLSSLGRFPKLSQAKKHGYKPVQNAIRALEDQAILYEVKNDRGENIVGIPEEFVPEIKEWLHFELSEEETRRLLHEVDEFKRGTLNKVMKTCDLGSASGNDQRIERIAQSKVLPSEVLEIGLERETLKIIVDRYRVDISKRKSNDELAESIVESFLDWGGEDEEIGWDNPQYLDYYEELASLEPGVPPFTNRLEGELKRSDIKNVYDKEFEIATAEIFKHVLGIKQTELLGHTDSRVPDGRIEWGDDVILWDNKATGSKYNLGTDDRAFKEYIDDEDTNVELFVIISKGFTASTHGKIDTEFNSKKNFHTSVCLVKAEDFKKIAQYWKNHILVENEDVQFPLETFLQKGKFDFEKAKDRLKRNV